MAPRAKPAAKRGGGKTLKDQINGLSPLAVKEFFEELHSEFDDAEEASATSRGKINRIYDKACERLDVSKEALKMVFGEERSQKKKEAAAAKMDSRSRDSLARFGAALGDSPLGNWATSLSKVEGPSEEPEQKPVKAPKGRKKTKNNVVPLKPVANEEDQAEA